MQLVANRQRITLPAGKDKPIPLTDENKSLADYGVPGNTTLRLKDLGFQVGYRWLYIWEYVSGGICVARGCMLTTSSQAGPIFLNPLFLVLSQKIWGPYEVSALQL